MYFVCTHTCKTVTPFLPQAMKGENIHLPPLLVTIRRGRRLVLNHHPSHPSPCHPLLLFLLLFSRLSANSRGQGATPYQAKRQPPGPDGVGFFDFITKYETGSQQGPADIWRSFNPHVGPSPRSVPVSAASADIKGRDTGKIRAVSAQMADAAAAAHGTPPPIGHRRHRSSSA